MKKLKKINKTKKAEPALKKTKKKAVKKLNLPKTIASKSLKQKFTTGYYHCLANSWGSGKITDCCAKCKKEAQNLTVHREQELEKFGKAYRQMGESMFNLFKPLQPIKH